MNQAKILREALDDYRITSDNLWAVFYQRKQRAIELNGGGAVGCRFYLACAGSQGADQIQSIEIQGNHFLGCFSLSSLEHIESSLHAAPQSMAQHTTSFFSFLHQNFLIFTEENNKDPNIIRVKANTLDDAIKHAQKIHPEAVISFGGNEQDLKIMLDDMRKVLVSQDYSKIEFDRRGYIGRYEANDLLLAKKTQLAIEPLLAIYS